MNLLAGLSLAMIVAAPTAGESAWFAWLQAGLEWPVYLAFLGHLAVAGLGAGSLGGFLRADLLDLLFVIPLFFLNRGGVHPGHLLVIRQVGFYFQRTLHRRMVANLAGHITAQPGRLIAFSFAGVILIGALLLSLPVSVAAGCRPSFLSALFTSTSAVCVTGLIVVDTPTYFTGFGQFVILLLIQVGGLGIMALSAATSLLIGKRLAVSERTLLQNALEQADVASLKTMAKQIVVLTALFEGIGAALLSARFYQAGSANGLDACRMGVFHAVSAFCNAGFALFPDSLIGFRGDAAVILTIGGLVVLGGLGFPVLGTMLRRRVDRRQPVDLHTWLALVTTALLLIGGTVLFYVMEAGHSLTGFSATERWLSALFQSLTTRTAGFNSLDIERLQPATLFLMIGLMFIGASPGSTGGGVKTTTAATLWLALRALLHGRNAVECRGRTVPADVVNRALGVLVLSASVIAITTFVLLLTEEASLLHLLFEATSAFATVGLSMNLTPHLSAIGQVLIIVVMFIGRIGPLTMALSLSGVTRQTQIRYPLGRLSVG